MRTTILLAALVVVLTGAPAESFAAPKQQGAKQSDNQSAAGNGVRPQIRNVLTKSPAYHLH